MSGKKVTPNRKLSLDLPEIPGRWVEKTVAVGGHQFLLAVPDDPDLLLDDAQVLKAQQQDDFMPYWAYLWPVAIEMAGWVLQEATWPTGTRVLEIGAGLGLVSVAAMSRGDVVTTSDYTADAVQTAKHNATLNGYQPADSLTLDWREPLDVQYPVILGCDVIYEARNGSPILKLLDQMLAPGGICWLGDQVRTHSQSFVSLATDHGYDVEQFDTTGNRTDSPKPGSFQRLVLRRIDITTC